MLSYYFHNCSITAVFAVLVALSTGPACAESWTSLHGGRTVEAKMIGLWGDSVVLEMEDGRRVTVSLGDLQARSRIQARELAEAQAKSRASLVNEFKAQADEAAAPAPNPIPKPSSAPAYVQPKPNATVIDQLVLVDAQSRAGHAIAAFDALPPSYRNEISELAKIAAAKINVDAWQSLIGAIHSIGEVIVTRQRWVFSHPRLAAMPPETLEPVEGTLLLVAGLIRDGFDPEAMDLQKFQSMPLRDWLMERDQAMAPYLAEINQYSGSLNQQSFELVAEKDGVANVKVSLGETSMTVPYTAVEGFWVPKQFADNWADWMKQARDKLDATPDGSLMTDSITTMIPTMIKPIVDPMVAAQDKQSFHAAMENMFAQAAPMATLAGVDLSGKRGRSGSEDGYDMDSEMEEYYDDMDMEMEMDSQYEGRTESMQPEYGGSGSPNPDIGGRLEEEMRSRRGP